jgi:hypothetical protein
MEIVPIYLFTNRSNVASANGYYGYQDILFTSKPNLRGQSLFLWIGCRYRGENKIISLKKCGLKIDILKG